MFRVIWCSLEEVGSPCHGISINWLIWLLLILSITYLHWQISFCGVGNKLLNYIIFRCVNSRAITPFSRERSWTFGPRRKGALLILKFMQQKCNTAAYFLILYDRTEVVVDIFVDLCKYDTKTCWYNATMLTTLSNSENHELAEPALLLY